jgi:hypothetical protein
MLSIQLHAQNLEKNINRFYGVRVTKNLFGAWTITIQYTQFRTRGPTKLFFCDSLEEARARVQLILKRRMNYNRRMECKYSIAHIDSDPSIVLDEWIPEFSTLTQPAPQVIT